MQTKAPIPLSLFNGQPVPALLAAYLEINHLKQLYRQGWLLRGIPREQCESVADHVFGMALLAMIVADTLEDGDPPVDQERVLRMVLVHELGEVYAGDITPADGISDQEKQERERQSVRRVCEHLTQGAQYLALWEEFEAGETLEARLVRQLDRLEMGLQAAVYQAQFNEVNLEEFFRSARAALSDATLVEFLEQARSLRRS